MRALQCLSLAFLFLANPVPSKAQEGAEGGAEALVEVREGAPLTIECALRVEQRAEWRREGGAVPADLRAGEAAAGGRLTARLHAAAARAQHAGLYSCGRAPAQRVRVRVLPAHPPHAPHTPHAAHTPHAPAPTDAEKAEVAAAAPEPVAAPAGLAPDVVVFELGAKFSLNCTGLRSQDYDAIVWKKNGTEVDKTSDLSGRYELKDNMFQLIKSSNENDFGNYTCGKGDVAGDAGSWRVALRAHAKLPPNTNVVEGQKLKLQCKLIGKPYPPVTWTFSNSSEDTNGTDVVELLGSRVTLQRSEQGVEGGELVLAEAQRSDAGVYTCRPLGGAPDSTTLRVKDMYAALWPFLGICIEVFILCAIILVYEKRRTKPELDDSDTDNHDQKKS